MWTALYQRGSQSRKDICNIHKTKVESLSLLFTVNTDMSFTYKPKKKKRAKTHGFLSRSKTPGGRSALARRRRKGRTSLSTSDR